MMTMMIEDDNDHDFNVWPCIRHLQIRNQIKAIIKVTHLCHI